MQLTIIAHNLAILFL